MRSDIQDREKPSRSDQRRSADTAETSGANSETSADVPAARRPNDTAMRAVFNDRERRLYC